MCGIVVDIERTRKVDPRDVELMISKIKHRGPDSNGIFCDENLGLGSQRLRIHDLSNSSDQPMRSPCGRFIIVFNGAVYNFRELRNELRGMGVTFETKSDTEVLLQAFILFREGVLNRIEGMFVFVVFDLKAKTLFIARDHVGVKPLYFYKDDNVFLAGSEVKALLCRKEVKTEVNRDCIPEFFSFQAIAPPDTLFKNIHVMPPASYFYIDVERFKISDPLSYWSPSVNHNKKITVDELESKLFGNVKNCWETDRNTALQLSGGVDSSLIAQWLNQLHPGKKIETYSVLFNDNNRRFYKATSEKKWIDIVTNKFGFDGKGFIFAPVEIRTALPFAIFYNELPITGASTTLYYLLAKALKNKISVILTGEAVDDIFNGYFNQVSFDDNIESISRFYVQPCSISRLFKISESNDPLRKSMETLSKPDFDNFSKSQKASLLTIQQSLHALLARHDRMFMSQSIEGRPPFASKNILEARFQLKDTEIMSKGHGKFFLKELCAKYFGSDFAFRPKIGFSSPYGDWLSDKNYWGGYWHLLNKELIGEYMNLDYLQSIFELPDDPIKWSGQNLNILMCVLNFQIWHQLFFEGRSPESLAHDSAKFSL